jgi:hypothetical protein
MDFSMNLPNLISPNADVRMKGFLSRTTVEEAWKWIASTLSARSGWPVEHVPEGSQSSHSG